MLRPRRLSLIDFKRPPITPASMENISAEREHIYRTTRSRQEQRAQQAQTEERDQEQHLLPLIAEQILLLRENTDLLDLPNGDTEQALTKLAALTPSTEETMTDAGPGENGVRRGNTARPSGRKVAAAEGVGATPPFDDVLRPSNMGSPNGDLPVQIPEAVAAALALTAVEATKDTSVDTEAILKNAGKFGRFLLKRALGIAGILFDSKPLGNTEYYTDPENPNRRVEVDGPTGSMWESIYGEDGELLESTEHINSELEFDNNGSFRIVPLEGGSTSKPLVNPIPDQNPGGVVLPGGGPVQGPMKEEFPAAQVEGVKTETPDQSEEVRELTNSGILRIAPEDPGGHIVHGGPTPKAPGFRKDEPAGEPLLNFGSQRREEYEQWLEGEGASLLRRRENREIVAIAPKESFIWRNLQNVHGKSSRTNGLSGKKRRTYEWDFDHGEIEVYDSNGRHMGAIDGLTGRWTDGRKSKRDDKDKTVDATDVLPAPTRSA